MAYCTKSEVKKLLLIDESETKYDSIIDDGIAFGDAQIDLALSPYEEDLPLDYPGDAVKYISAMLAAGYVKRRLMPQDATGEWTVLGRETLEKYIKATYLKGEFSFHET